MARLTTSAAAGPLGTARQLDGPGLGPVIDSALPWSNQCRLVPWTHSRKSFIEVP